MTDCEKLRKILGVVRRVFGGTAGYLDGAFKWIFGRGLGGINRVLLSVGASGKIMRLSQRGLWDVFWQR
jgi:hypothetical protein